MRWSIPHARKCREVSSALAEFPIIGGQFHDQLGVEHLSGTLPSLLIGIGGALIGGRGFAQALQKTLNTVWAVPKADRPGPKPIGPPQIERQRTLRENSRAAQATARNASTGSPSTIGHGFRNSR